MIRSVLLLVFAGFWYLFFQAGAFVTVQSHFTNTPEKYPEFQFTQWRPDPGLSTIFGQPVLAREAVYPLTFFTLRYSLHSLDSGVTTEVYGREANVRWLPTSLVMAASAVLFVVLDWYLGRYVVR